MTGRSALWNINLAYAEAKSKFFVIGLYDRLKEHCQEVLEIVELTIVIIIIQWLLNQCTSVLQLLIEILGCMGSSTSCSKLKERGCIV